MAVLICHEFGKMLQLWIKVKSFQGLVASKLNVDQSAKAWISDK